MEAVPEGVYRSDGRGKNLCVLLLNVIVRLWREGFFFYVLFEGEFINKGLDNKKTSQRQYYYKNRNKTYDNFPRKDFLIVINIVHELIFQNGIIKIFQPDAYTTFTIKNSFVKSLKSEKIATTYTHTQPHVPYSQHQMYDNNNHPRTEKKDGNSDAFLIRTLRKTGK